MAELKTAWELSQELGQQECQLSNELVHQKDELLRLVHVGTVDAYQRALTCLEFVAPLWAQQGYGYKVREIKSRCQFQINQDLEVAKSRVERAQLTALLMRCY